VDLDLFENRWVDGLNAAFSGCTARMVKKMVLHFCCCEDSTRHALCGAELRQQTPSFTADNTLRLQRNRFDFDSMPTEFTGRLRQPATLGHRYNSVSIPKEIIGRLAWYQAQASVSHRSSIFPAAKSCASYADVDSFVVWPTFLLERQHRLTFVGR
jgi:hypothetical protein